MAVVRFERSYPVAATALQNFGRKELENPWSQRRAPSLLLSNACGMMQPMK
jgi:hypothetical protein